MLMLLNFRGLGQLHFCRYWADATNDGHPNGVSGLPIGWLFLSDDMLLRPKCCELLSL